eukprot:1189805-Heterocapsa_arctica.AAC.1
MHARQDRRVGSDLRGVLLGLSQDRHWLVADARLGHHGASAASGNVHGGHDQPKRQHRPDAPQRRLGNQDDLHAT